MAIPLLSTWKYAILNSSTAAQAAHHRSCCNHRPTPSGLEGLSHRSPKKAAPFAWRIPSGLTHPSGKSFSDSRVISIKHCLRDVCGVMKINHYHLMG